MKTLGDLVARKRRTDDLALATPRETRTYDYRRFRTTAWKTGNFFRRLGVHDDATVAVADDPAPEAVFAFFGAALLGARTEFGPPRGRDRDARVAVAPRGEIGEYDLSPGGQRVAYGGPPDDPAVHQFERDVWSENPAFPDTPIDPEAVAGGAAGGDDRDDSDGDRRDGRTASREFSHADLLSAAREVADDWGLEPGDEVAVRAPLAVPGTVVAGVVAPLLAGAAILLPDDDATGDYAVAEGEAPESRVVRPNEIV